ncbi:hypothetical protein ACFFMN_00645 [Planobispora siamensis]|uniref:hypothetical protein n=1 Tax=Planobispora siamensis TaxID=936338 RepID=UPI0035E84023
MAAAAVAVVLLSVAAVLVTAAAGHRGMVVAYDGGSPDGELPSDECHPWSTNSVRRYTDTRPQDREKAFLCLATESIYGLPPKFSGMGDREALAYGRELCGVMNLEVTDPRVKALLDRTGNGPYWTTQTLEALVYLCPEGVARHDPRLVQSEEQLLQEEKESLDEAAAGCRDRWKGPKPRNWHVGVVFVEEGSDYYVGDPGGEWGEVVAGSGGGVLEVYREFIRVYTSTRNDLICVTVLTFDKAPPLLPRGWDRIVEAGVRSPDGRLIAKGSEVFPTTFNLAAAGPGRYRVRIYTRDHEQFHPDDPDRPGVEHLVVVFPGRSGKTVVHRR